MEHGIITATRYEKGVVLCNVQAIRVDTEYRDVPMLKPFDGFAVVPSIGQKVTMTKLGDGTRFITQVLARRPEEERPASLESGEVSIQLDADTKLTFTKNGADGYNVELSASGDVTVSSAGHLQFNAQTVDFSTGGS
ncbi:baseplate assembly protein V [Haloarcula virus HCTV-15]|uniref:Uncharacterized protein n=1 Tax=Halorubrum sodomense tailed virus 2 TaxID=1262527 RepID=L7THI6_9CAUD|nr:hypothetical protein HSTV2_27 [Halorubrum sodomense tailed virus 2]AGC34296.1 hypothetical protein HSTV2_27 [Halorubrum sodomense tailed virus 2]UBF22284.1 baseplate assembly protein V [Halorubrum virus HRTV-11]UBF22394.1 baseplate assembly protein V [Haloarcula virus HCTV-6]UBF22501.1 baseplate assembly protein V [Haloarcula virus HCTV-15]